MIQRSDRLTHVHSDIRGPLYVEALQMQAAGTPVLKLNTGNPGNFGFPMPQSVRQALLEHIDEAVPYCDVRGMAAARKAILDYHRERGLQGITMDDIYICNGVSEAVSMLMTALVGTGDEVLVPSPCYSLWSNNTYLGGGKPVHYRCDPKNDWNPDLADIRSKITPRTKAILVINPNNPTGAVYSRETLLEIAQLAREHHLLLLADEIYDRLVLEDLPTDSLGALAPDLYHLQRPFQVPHHLRLPLRLDGVFRPGGGAYANQAGSQPAGGHAPVRQHPDPAGNSRRPCRPGEHPGHDDARRTAVSAEQGHGGGAEKDPRCHPDPQQGGLLPVPRFGGRGFRL